MHLDKNGIQLKAHHTKYKICLNFVSSRETTKSNKLMEIISNQL